MYTCSYIHTRTCRSKIILMITAVKVHIRAEYRKLEHFWRERKGDKMFDSNDNDTIMCVYVCVCVCVGGGGGGGG